MSPQTRRRTPQFRRFIVTGALLGFVLGFLIAVVGDPAPNYAAGSQIGYFGVMGACLGALIAALVAVLLDRRD